MKHHLAETEPIAIIGAGLAGFTLALSLNQAKIPCKIYEMRPADGAPAGGAIMLSPNTLRILDNLGLYDTLRGLGWEFESLHYLEDLSAGKNNNGAETSAENGQFKPVGRYDFGGKEKYGYKALRIYRESVLSTMKAAVVQSGIKIEYGRKFLKVVKENQHSVRIRFTDGGEVDAPLVVGADGIHSSVREWVERGVEPKYAGIMGVSGAVDRRNIRFPAEFGDSGESFPMPATIQTNNEAFVLAPQTPDGGEVFCGTQFRHAELGRTEWKNLAAAKEKLRDMVASAHTNSSDLIQSAAENFKLDTMSIWAFYMVSKLKTWSSEGKRVVILGDAAHAIPPTAGQGATQAFEDAFSLAALLSYLPRGTTWSEALEWWQGVRQQRIDHVLALTARLNNSRLTKEQREQLPADKLWSSNGKEDLGWLYNYNIEEEVIEWVKAAKSGCPVKTWLSRPAG